MAIAYAASTVFAQGNGTSISGVAKPSGTAIGDVLIAQCYAETAGAAGALSIASTDDTWTLVHSITNTSSTPDFEFYVWICVVANASSTISVTWDGDSIWRDFAVHRFTGVDTTTPQDVTATENTGTGTTATGLGLASGSANRWLVLCECNFDEDARSGWTSPLTERDDSGNVSMAAGADTAGTDTANKTVTLATGGSPWATVMLALREAGAGTTFKPRLTLLGVG